MNMAKISKNTTNNGQNCINSLPSKECDLSFDFDFFWYNSINVSKKEKKIFKRCIQMFDLENLLMHSSGRRNATKSTFLKKNHRF